MKKILLMLIALSFFGTAENASAWPWSKKDTDSEALSKDGSDFKGLGDIAASISTRVDEFSRKNYTGENDVAALIPLRIFTKNASELFSWMYVLLNALKTDYEKVLKAKESQEKAKSEKDQTKADASLTAAMDGMTKTLELLFGNGILSLRANVKASAGIWLQMIAKGDFSEAGASNIKKDLASLKSKIDATAIIMKTFAETFVHLKEALGGDLEIDDNEVAGLTEDINTTLDVLEQINVYFTKKERPSEEVIVKLKERCSLAKRRASPSEDSEREGSSNTKSESKSKSKR